jgi:hypothetical protein
MSKRTEIVEIRLPQRTAAGVYEVAKLAGVKPETVIKVMMALAVLSTPLPETKDRPNE